jgi:hypothetical protein
MCETLRQALVVHPCNPSFSGGIDWKNHSSSPAQVKSSQVPISTEKLRLHGMLLTSKLCREA